MIDPDNIETNTEISLQLPRLISAHDYHDFGFIQDLIQNNLGIEGVYVTEVGFESPDFVALIHIDCESHNQMVMELQQYYKDKEEKE